MIKSKKTNHNKLKLFLILSSALLLLSLPYFFINEKGENLPASYSGENNSDDNEKTQTFIFIADTGTATKRQYDIANGIDYFCRKNPCKAVFIAGDVIYDLGVKSVDDKQFISKFEKVYQNINLPFYIAFGNHDYFGCTECYLGYSKRSDKWNMPKNYYRVDFENVSFFIINTEDYDGIQNNWLVQELPKNKSRWKIIIGHRPIETTEEQHGGEQWTGIKEFKNTICQQADLYISGHAHVLEDVGRIDNCKAIQLISGGGGAVPRKVYSYSQSPFYFEGNGFLAIEMINDGLYYKFLNVEGKMLSKNNLRDP